jgi:hypothetical protein
MTKKTKTPINSNKINITIHNDRKTNKKRHRKGTRKVGNKINLGEPRQNLLPAGPDMSSLVNQVVHENKVIREKNALIENVKQQEPDTNGIYNLLANFKDNGGVIKQFKNSVNLSIPQIKKHTIRTPLKFKKKDRVEELDEELDNDLNNMFQNPNNDNYQDINQVLERDDDEFQNVNDNRAIEPHNDEGLNEKAVKKKAGRKPGSKNKIKLKNTE